MGSQSGLLVVTNIKVVVALFCLVVSISTAVFLCYYRKYKRELYTLFIFFLVSTILYCIALLFESAAVDIVLGSDKYETFWYNNKLANVLCTTQGILIHYTTILDLLLITTITVWVVRLTVKSKTLEEAIEKSTKKSSLCYFVLMSFCLIIPLPYVLGFIKLNKGLWCHVNQAELNDTDIDWIYFAKHLAYLEVPIFALSTLNVALFVYRKCMMTFKMNISEVRKIQTENIRKEGTVLIVLILTVLITIIISNVEIMVIMVSNILIVVTRLVLPSFKAVQIGIRSIMIIFLFIYLIKNKSKMQKQSSDTNILYQREETQLMFPNYNRNNNNNDDDDNDNDDDNDDEELEED